MKKWKRLLPALLAAAMLVSCGKPGSPAESSLPGSSLPEEPAASEPAAPSVPSEPESSEESLPPESSEEEKELPSPVRTLETEYEAMEIANSETYPKPNIFLKGTPPYYTVQKDGKWGLIDENGTELLPCMADGRARLCPEGHWIWWASCSPEEWEQFSAALGEATGMPLCAGHGGSSCRLFAVNPGDPARVYWGMEGAGGIEALEDAHTWGDSFFPTLYTGIDFEGETGIDLNAGGFWNFSNREGRVLCPGEEFEQVGWFSNEALAPVQKNGKWAYADSEGRLVSDFVYDSCWGSDYLYDKASGEYAETSPCYAYSLMDGAAPVVRDGKWGVLDETGAEAIPCCYDGGAPYPGGAWLREDGQWKLFLLK